MRRISLGAASADIGVSEVSAASAAAVAEDDEERSQSRRPQSSTSSWSLSVAAERMRRICRAHDGSRIGKDCTAAANASIPNEARNTSSCIASPFSHKQENEA